MSIMLILASVIAIFVLGYLAHIFLDFIEIKWKVFYLISTWLSLATLFFKNSDTLLRHFLPNDDLDVLLELKHFQHVVTVTAEFAIMASWFLTAVFAILVGTVTWHKRWASSTTFTVRWFGFLLVYGVVYVYMFLIYDLLMGAWDGVREQGLQENADFQMDYLIFYAHIYDDFYQLSRGAFILGGLTYILVPNYLLHEQGDFWYKTKIARRFAIGGMFFFKLYFFGFGLFPVWFFICLIAVVSLEFLFFMCATALILRKGEAKSRSEKKPWE